MTILRFLLDHQIDIHLVHGMDQIDSLDDQSICMDRDVITMHNVMISMHLQLQIHVTCQQNNGESFCISSKVE